MSSRTARAEGREFAAQQHDLRILVDTRWTGCRLGGYYPIRVRVTNTGFARNLTFRFTAHDRRLPRVQRTVGVEQNATVQLTLPIPMVGQGNYGNFAVLDSGGVPLKSLQWDLSLPDVSWNEIERPSLLVISPNQVDVTTFEQAVYYRFTQPVAAAGGYYGSSPATSDNHQILPPTLLPDTWLAYSGVDLVAVPLDVLAGLGTGPRSALVAWVETGGTLLVTNVGGPAETSEKLRKALALETRGAAGKAWTKANAKERNQARLQPRSGPGAGGAPGIATVVSEGEPMPEGMASVDFVRFSWPDSPDAFQQLRLMHGTVVAFATNPFPGTVSDWSWLFRSLPDDAGRWTVRNGLSSRLPHSEFLQFEIPGLRGVPVSAFLTLMTVFALCIGPLNYFVLWKKKRLWMLVVTIPALSFGTSVVLFGYSTLAHGFSVKSRTRSFTLLDQASKTAVTTARISLFAGVAPSRGLRFSPETAVYPVWPTTDDAFETGAVDWTDTQALDSNWLRSRTRTQFVTVNHRTERGRLIVGAAENGTLSVENGFPWAIESLVVADADGTLYAGGPLPAGSGTRLKKVEKPEDLSAWNGVLERFPLKLPEGAQSGVYGTYGSFRHRSPYYPQNQTSNLSFSQSRFERELARLKNPLNGKRVLKDATAPVLPPKSYAASFAENPGVEMGVAAPREQAPLHVLLGNY